MSRPALTRRLNSDVVETSGKVWRTCCLNMQAHPAQINPASKSIYEGVWRMSHTWFRFYNSAVEDPKVQRLSASIFRFWVNILCIASKNEGKLPPKQDMQFTLRIGEKELDEMLSKLKSAALLDELDGCLSPHNWENRQFLSDGSTERVQRFRERHRNVSLAVSETGPDSDQIQKQTRGRTFPRAQEGAGPPPSKQTIKEQEAFLAKVRERHQSLIPKLVKVNGEAAE